MNDLKDKIVKLREILSHSPQRIAIVTHTNPDGDAIGSMLAWAEMLDEMGHTVNCLTPNRYPYFLNWMNGIDRIVVDKDNPEQTSAILRDAELIFCMDMNTMSRLENMTEAIEANQTAQRILIDHHLSPPDEFVLQFSYPQHCSTSYIVCLIIEAMSGTERIDRTMAENLYAGIMTDTGNLSYSSLTPDLFRCIAMLVERGLDIPKINVAVYSSFTESRVRLLGFTLCNKMHLIEGGKVAYMSLTEREMRSHNFQLGDSEGFVNYPLSIEGVKMSAMFLETRKFIRVSLRSRGNVVDVNCFARRYFEGGGHKNAAGGKSFDPVNRTIERYIAAVAEYFAELEAQEAGQ